MTRRLNLLWAVALTLLYSTMSMAQSATLTDDAVVKDPDGQHKEWKEGKTKYPSKPKDMWELGLHGGFFTIQGDVEFLPGWAAGIHLRKSLGYTFAIRLNGMYGNAKGLNSSPSMVGAYLNQSLRNIERDGGTIPGYGAYEGRGTGTPFFHNFKNTYAEAGIQGILTLNNIKFHKERNKWNIYFIAGPTVQYYKLQMDALKDGAVYSEFNDLASQFDLNSRTGRKDIKKKLRDEILDGDYETDGEMWGNLFNLAGEDEETTARVNIGLNVGLGLAYHLGKRVTLSLEHQATLVDDDLQDGYRWAEQGDFTRDVDIPQYTHLRIGIHLGSFKKRVEPLWWMNPLDAPYERIAENTAKEMGDKLTDEDGDGVPDKLDREPNTPEGAPVDTHGVTLDSDGDGIPDYEDQERFSPPGYEVNPQGVAQVPPPPAPDLSNYVTKDQLGSMVPPRPSGCADDWFLPMIHFDLDKYYMKPEFYPQLHHVATVLKRCPAISIVAKGHTDVRLPNQYNTVLSYKRAKKAIDYLVTNYNIERSRLVLNYGGEDEPLIPGLPANHAIGKEKEKAQYMNRRVEFFVARNGEGDQGAPAYDGNFDAVGKDTPKSSRGGSKYSGNPSSGY